MHDRINHNQAHLLDLAEDVAMETVEYQLGKLNAVSDIEDGWVSESEFSREYLWGQLKTTVGASDDFCRGYIDVCIKELENCK